MYKTMHMMHAQPHTKQDSSTLNVSIMAMHCQYIAERKTSL